MSEPALEERGTTYRRLILEKHPGLQIKHVHHAGNSSGVVDGAAALLIASPAYARKRGLTAKVIFVSGYADDAFARNLPEGQDFVFLPKPFSLKQLIETVKGLMN